jgi:glycosyltransferase involved in cell wall biosynthesis
VTSSGESATAPWEIVYLVRSWPRLSQTFVLDEVLGLERLSVPVRIVALSASGEALAQAELDHVTARVDYLAGAPGPWQVLAAHVRSALSSPLRYLSVLWLTWRHREWDEGYHTASRWRCLLFALQLTALQRDVSRHDRGHVRHLHAHFAHDPAAVAFLTHQLTDVPWSFTAHARDLWQVQANVLAERVRSARFAVACCRDGAEHLRESLPAQLRGRVRVVHHGVDVTSFRPAPRRPGSDARSIVSVGRLVKKKGFEDLLAACRLLADEGRQFRCTIFGEGPLEAELADQIRCSQLSELVTLSGARTRRELLPVLQAADIFALTPYVTADGDRDGIPNVVVEAMACATPVVATAIGGIPEAVVHGVSGLLAAPRDVAGIAAHLATLLDDPQLRSSIGAAARRAVLDSFDSRAAARELAQMFASSEAEGTAVAGLRSARERGTSDAARRGKPPAKGARC